VEAEADESDEPAHQVAKPLAQVVEEQNSVVDLDGEGAFDKEQEIPVQSGQGELTHHFVMETAKLVLGGFCRHIDKGCAGRVKATFNTIYLD
jgi:hypothetical protein